MTSIPVKFAYYTGLKRGIFRNPRLVGSWNSGGLYSDQWSTVPMQSVTGEDGCPAFVVTVNFDAAQVGYDFHWGVVLDGPEGRDQWGIMTEVNDHTSTDRRRTFKLRAAGGGATQEERYYLTHCRRLGAQKHYKDGQDTPGIRFSV